MLMCLMCLVCLDFPLIFRKGRPRRTMGITGAITPMSALIPEILLQIRYSYTDDEKRIRSSGNFFWKFAAARFLTALCLSADLFSLANCILSHFQAELCSTNYSGLLTSRHTRLYSANIYFELSMQPHGKNPLP